MYFQNHYLWLIPIFLIAGLVSYLLYFYKLNSFTTKLKLILFSIKFTTLSLIGFLLLQPYFINEKTIEYSSRVVLAVDVSKSIPLKTDTNLILNTTQSFLNFDWQNLKPQVFYFGENTVDSFSGFNQSFTNIQQAIQNIQQSYPAYSVPHIILITDGIVNSGNDLKYLNSTENKIHTILIGDSSAYPQIKINAVYHNKSSFLNNDFVVNYEIYTQKFKGQQINLKWYLGDSLQQQKKLPIQHNKQLISGDIELKATKSGLQKIIVQITNNEGKIIQSYQSFIKIIQNKKKVLFCYSSPHPDVAAIQNALKNFQDYELKFTSTNNLTTEDLTKQNLIIYMGFPSIENWKTIEKSKTNFLLFTSNLPNQSFQNTYLNITPNNKKSDEIFVSNNNQNYLKLNPSILFKLPPIYKPNANYSLKGNKITVWNFRYGNVDTDKPLLQFSAIEKQKFGVFWANGIWRWNLTDDEEQKQLFQSWINQLVAYFTNDKQNKRLQIQHKDWYYENEKISFNAWSYFKNLDFNPDAELILTLSNNKQKNNFKLFLQQNKYNLTLPNLPLGEYNYLLKSNYVNDTLSLNGKFVISSQNIEFNNTEANWKDLIYLSKKTNGKSILTSQFDELCAQINKSDYPVIESTQEIKSNILDYWFIYLLIILLWSSEWLIS